MGRFNSFWNTDEMIESSDVGFLKKHESLLFIAICLTSLLPLFTSKYFATIDGPSHLYNAKLLGYLVQNGDAFVSQFFSVNSLMPNAITHVILSILLSFLPAFLAEKILVATYIILFAFSFRYLLKAFPNNNSLLSFLIFPFIFSYPFLLGFYNFSFGIVLLFFTLGYWIKRSEKQVTILFIITLLVLVFLTYLSHLVLFGLLVSLLFLHFVLANFTKKKLICREQIVKSGLPLILACITPLYFLFQYFRDRPVSESNFHWIDFSQLLQYLIDLRPIIAYNFPREVIFTRFISFTFILLIVFYFIGVFRSRKAKKETLKPRNRVKVGAFAGLALVYLVLVYFIFPDSDGRGSYVSIRFGLIIFPFLILFLSQVDLPRKVLTISIVIVLIAHFGLIAQYAIVNKQISPMISEIADASSIIEENAIVAVVRESDLWYMAHSSNYLGIDKEVAILDNYEATYGYFPVVWNPEAPKTTILGKTLTEKPCLIISKANKRTSNRVEVDYIAVIGNVDSLSVNCSEINEIIEKSKPNRLYQSETFTLIKFN